MGCVSLESDAFDHYTGQDDLEPEPEPGLWPCERCGTYRLLTSVPLLVCPQTRESPAEYEVLWLCDGCIEGR